MRMKPQSWCNLQSIISFVFEIFQIFLIQVTSEHINPKIKVWFHQPFVCSCFCFLKIFGFFFNFERKWKITYIKSELINWETELYFKYTHVNWLFLFHEGKRKKEISDLSWFPRTGNTGICPRKYFLKIAETFDIAYEICSGVWFKKSWALLSPP